MAGFSMFVSDSAKVQMDGTGILTLAIRMPNCGALLHFHNIDEVEDFVGKVNEQLAALKADIEYEERKMC